MSLPSNSTAPVAKDAAPPVARPPGVGVSIAMMFMLSVSLFLLGGYGAPLADPEESRTALVAQTMIQTGDWLAPHLQGQAYFSQPAPLFWLVAAGQRLTGDLAWGGRLIDALFGLGAVLVTFALGRRLGGNWAGLLAGLVLAIGVASLEPFRGHGLDMPFTALAWTAVWWFWRYEPAPGQACTHRRARWLGFYAFCAAATLMQGPAGLLLPAVVVWLYILAAVPPGQRWGQVAESLYLPGILLYLAVAAPWFLAMSLRHSSYAYEFFVAQTLSTFTLAGLSGCLLPALPPLAALIGWAVAGWAIRGTRGRRIVAGIGVLGALLLSCAMVLATDAYRPNHQRLGTLARERLTPSALLCSWPEPSYSFTLYAGRTNAVDFDTARPGELGRLVQALSSDQPVYCLVSSPARLDELKAACPTPVYILDRHGERFLVTNQLQSASTTEPASQLAGPEGRR